MGSAAADGAENTPCNRTVHSSRFLPAIAPRA
jgi:hypothetical protein